MLMVEEITARAKRAIRAWAGIAANAPMLLEDTLARFRSEEGLLDLLTKVNVAFEDQATFPIRAAAWQNPLPKTVADVCGRAQKQIAG